MPNEILSMVCDIGRALAKRYERLGRSEAEIYRAYALYKIAVRDATGTHFDDFDFKYDSDYECGVVMSEIVHKETAINT